MIFYLTLMSSAVYFKFKASIKQYTIPFDGSAISVKDLRSAIRLSCGLKSTDFELQILDKQGKEYSKEDDLIPKFSDLIVRRLPKANDMPRKKIANPEDMTRRDPYKAINSLPKINPYSNSINLAKSNIPDDEKIDIMAKRCSEEYSEKNFLVKSKPYGIPPASYVCNKCHQGGHWIHECPGLRDKDGRLLDFKSVKRPTGIPQDFLLEVSPGTPGAYLTKEGKYMVPIKDAEAYAMGKKEKRPFSIEENPPYVPKDQEFPSKIKCSLCCKLLENPTCAPCCSSVYCEKCITDYLYDPEVNGSRKCPNCQSLIEHHTSLIEHELLRQLIQCWKANLLTKEIVDSCVTTLNHSSNKKTELNEVNCASPDMKYESANTDVDSLSNKAETEKVFVNNRRVLKPKTVSLIRTDSPSNIKPSTPDKQNNAENKIDAINIIDPVKSIENEVKSEKIVNNNLNDIDVNDLIFEKVQDFEGVEENNVEKHENVVDSEKNIGQKSINDQNLKIETVVKRNDNGIKNSLDRKVDTVKGNSSSHNSRMDNMKGHIGNDLSSMHQPFSTIMNPGVDTTTHLINHFPTTTHLATSVQQQFLNNPIHMNTLEPLQWPLINSMYNNLPLHSMFGATLNPTTNTSNWINNGINIPPPPISNSRILTKEEFYERQRKLRAEKMKQKYRENSKSPSGSQSPRKHKSRSKYRDYKDKYEKKYNLNRQYKVPYPDNKHRDSKDEYDERESRSRHRRSNYHSPKDRGSFKSDFSNSDIKAIDPKLMEDSINTFLKYLTVNPDDKRDSVNEKSHEDNSSRYHASEYRSNKNNRSSKSKLISEDKPRVSRVLSRSRSVPKISRDRMEDNQRSMINTTKQHANNPRNDDICYPEQKLEIKKEVIPNKSAKYHTGVSVIVPAENNIYMYDKCDTVSLPALKPGTLMKEKKTKKSKTS
uniref:Retinoblastoma binding protein 6 n=1 Tax=Schmidtea mediterranea TaxID=79327 RepID=A0A0F7GWV9_SCHMD|nr:retinoblastoma binding protein 6 [Schmidtea mediterranea]